MLLCVGCDDTLAHGHGNPVPYPFPPNTRTVGGMRSPMQYIRGVRHPEGYHGRGRTKAYFEGWYIKLVSADLSQRWALIPGIFRGDSSAGSVDEAFIQVLDGVTGRSWYFPFAPDEFAADENRLAVTIGGNRFDQSGVMLDLPMISGSLWYSTPIDPYPVTLRRPGIMGWYGYLPFMECFHGIVSSGHELAGTLVIEDRLTEFTGGRGYIEKDWGTAFPESYVWLASNHLTDDGGAEIAGSLVASCAIIPGVGRTFRGSIVALKYPDRLSTWATWNGSRDDELTIDDSHVRWRMHGPDGTLSLRAERTRGGLLHAPLRSAMHRRVEETLDARIEFSHVGKDGTTIAAGTGECAGMEVFGDTARLTTMRQR